MGLLGKFRPGCYLGLLQSLNRWLGCAPTVFFALKGFLGNLHTDNQLFILGRARVPAGSCGVPATGQCTSVSATDKEYAL